MSWDYRTSIAEEKNTAFCRTNGDVQTCTKIEDETIDTPLKKGLSGVTLCPIHIQRSN